VNTLHTSAYDTNVTDNNWDPLDGYGKAGEGRGGEGYLTLKIY